jgi:hypothetical protein
MADLPPDNRTGAPNSATFDASSINPATSWSTHCRATTTLAAGSTHKLMKRPSPIDTGEPAALSCIRAGVTAEESTELRELKKRNRLLEHESRVLRRPAAYLSQRTCRENDLPISQLRASHEPPQTCPRHLCPAHHHRDAQRSARQRRQEQARRWQVCWISPHRRLPPAYRVAKTGVASRGELPPQPGLNPRLAVCYFIGGVVFWIAVTTSRIA